MSDYWLPKIAPRQQEAFDAPERYVLSEGPRKAGKSVGFQHKVMRHLVTHPYAVVGLFSRSIKQGKRGAWNDITGPIAREWISAGLTQFTVPPKYEADTKMAYCRFASANGGESELQIHSLGADENVEDKFKDTRFSLIYLIEADRFDEDTFAGLCMQLRSLEIPNEYQQVLLDCNPAEEGEDHWIHRRFFSCPDGMNLEVWQSQYRRIHFSLEDNPYITEWEKQDIFDHYRHDPVKLQRYYHGKWVRDDADGVFSKHFNHSIHVVGDDGAANIEVKDDRAIIRPGRATTALHSGWDIGDINSAIVFGAPRVDGNHLVYDIIDEIARIGEHASLSVITGEALEITNYWSKDYERRLKKPAPDWTHYSDTSSMRYKSGIDGTEAEEIEILSGLEISLTPVVKGQFSVLSRVDLLKRLLHEERIFVSSHCISVLEMFRALKPGTRRGEAVNPTSKFKHIFDALTYMLAAGMPDEIAFSRSVLLGKGEQPQSQRPLVWIP